MTAPETVPSPPTTIPATKAEEDGQRQLIRAHGADDGELQAAGRAGVPGDQPNAVTFARARSTPIDAAATA